VKQQDLGENKSKSFCLNNTGDRTFLVLLPAPAVLGLTQQGTIKSILNAVVVIATVLWLLNIFGLFHSLSRIHVGT